MRLNEIAAIPKFLPNIVPLLTSKCSEILSFYKKTNGFLYRGIKVQKPVIIQPEMNENSRMPVDVSIDSQRVIDLKLKESGFNALRGNSIFCKGSLHYAKSYGEPYIVFPCNGFHYTWSDKIYDLWFAETRSPWQDALHYPNEYTTTEFINLFGYRKGTATDTEDLLEAAKSLREIMIHSECIFLLAELY